jgi:hypothetical protein
MLQIADSIDYCLDGSHPYRLGLPTGIVIHRFSVSGCHDAAGVARFCRGEKSIGHRMAYSYVVGILGEIEQALPDNRHGWHCRASSVNCLAVAVLGDFRAQAPQSPQLRSLVSLCARLKTRYSGAVLLGHDEVVEGSFYLNHQCPGEYLNMYSLRDDVTQRLEQKKENNT